MKKHEFKPLYCIIAHNGGRFSIQYDTNQPTKPGGIQASTASREGYDLSTFEGLPEETPVIDHGTGDTSAIIKFIFTNDTPTQAGEVAEYLKRYSAATGSRVLSLGDLRAEAKYYEEEADHNPVGV